MVCEWQPIYTAPKDSRLVLTYTPHHNRRPRVYEAMLEGVQVASWCEATQAWHANAPGFEVQPTWWAPLPPLPLN